VKINPQKPTGPVVEVLFDRKSGRLSQPFKVDLSGEPSLSIVKVLSEEEICELA
jgi:hypothetical protein